MTEFDLANAHPALQRDVPEILGALAGIYPGANLASVSVYLPKRGDTSIATTLPGGHIKLSHYWFGQDPSYLMAAAERHPIIEVDGIEIGWHGPMRWEPLQVLTHEFGHVVGFSLPQREVDEWSTERWDYATHHPDTAPSGYSLQDPDEFFGEMFALVHLGYATDEEVRDLHELISRLR